MRPAAPALPSRGRIHPAAAPRPSSNASSPATPRAFSASATPHSPLVTPATPPPAAAAGLKRPERASAPLPMRASSQASSQEDASSAFEEPDEYAVTNAPATSVQMQRRRSPSPVARAARRSPSPAARGAAHPHPKLYNSLKLGGPVSPSSIMPLPRGMSQERLSAEMAELQMALMHALNDLEASVHSEASSKAVMQLALKFKQATAWAYGHDVSVDGFEVQLKQEVNPHAEPDLDCSFLKMLPLLFLHYVDAQPIDLSIGPSSVGTRSNILRAVSDILEAVSIAVHDNMANLNLLTNSVQYVDAGLLAVVQCAYVRARENALLCLASIALSVDQAALIAENPELRGLLKDNILAGSPEVKESAALVVNNVAAMGGESAIQTLASDHSLMRALIDLIRVGDGLQLMRAVSAFMHLSMSYRSAKCLARYDLGSVMLDVLRKDEVEGGEKTVQAFRALAEMTLANMAYFKDEAEELRSDAKAVASLVHFLRLALDRKPFNGIYFRVHDVMYSLSILSKNIGTHEVLQKHSLCGIVIDVVKKWKPGMYAGYFASKREDTHPVLEVATDILHAMCQTECFRNEMMKRDLLPVLDDLVKHDHDAVQRHAAKVIWSLRDRNDFLVHAAQIVKAVQGIRSICAHFNWTERERMLRVNGVLQGHELGAHVSEACQWMAKTIQFDQMDTIKFLLNGTQTRTLGTVFRAFRDAIFRLKQSQKIEQLSEAARTMLIRLRNFHEAKAFSGWKDALKSKQSAIARARETIFKWTNQTALRALNRWSEAIQRRKYRDSVLKRVLGHWMNRSMAVVWEGWSGKIKNQKRLMRAAQTIIGHWTHRNLAAPFDTWRAKTKHETYMKTVMKNVILKIQNRDSAVAFDTWREHVRYLVRSANILSRCIRHWLKRSAAEAFEGWKAHASNKQRLARAAKRVVMLWTRRSIAIPFVTWLDHANRIAHARAVTTSVILRIQNRTIAVAMFTWKANIEEHLAALGRAKKSVLHWLNSSKAKCFVSWIEFTAAEKRKVNMTNKVIARWTHRGTSKSFDAWNAFVRETKENLQKMRRVIMQWQRKTMSEAWHTWTFKVKHEQRMEIVMNKIIGRWMHMGTSEAWNTWVYRIKHDRRMEIVMQKIVSRWSHMGVSAAWSTWVGKVQHEKRMDLVMKKVISRWTHMNIGEAWAAWVEKCNFERRMEIVLNKIVGRWLHLSLASPFRTWADHSRIRQKTIEQANTIILRWYNLNLSRAFHGFREGITKHKIIFARCAKIVTRWQKLDCSTAFCRWHEQTIRRRVLKNKLLKALTKWSKTPMARSFTSWYQHTKYRMHLIRTSCKVMLAGQNQLLYTYFTFFVSACQPKLRKATKSEAAQRKAAQAIRKMLFASVAVAFEAWTQSVFHPHLLMGDSGASEQEYIFCECSISPALIDTDFEAMIIIETANAVKISKGRIVLTAFDNTNSTIAYKIIHDSTGRGPTCREVYANIQQQLLDGNSALRQCTVAGDILNCQLHGQQSDGDVQSTGNIMGVGVKKKEIMSELQTTRARAHKVEQELKQLKGMQKSLYMNVGIDITKELPHVVNEVLDVMDGNGILQGEEQYANTAVIPGDELIAIEDRDVTNASMDKVKAMLRGPPYSVVSLTMRRRQMELSDGHNETFSTYCTFKIHVMRHVSASRLPQDSDDEGDDILSALFRKKGPLGFLNFSEEREKLERL